MEKTEKTRYTDEELKEFQEILLTKLKKALSSFNLLNEAAQEIELSPVAFKILEEGSLFESKQIATILASHQGKIIPHLQAALYRIEKKTYGICFKTGKLIPRERLLACPVATTCIENK